MARTARDSRLDTRSVRSKLKPRREPYWRSISKGLAVGYRRGAKGGTWIARHYNQEAGRRYESLGTADDFLEPDGKRILNFSQAQRAAEAWLVGPKEVAIPFTVANAMQEYLAHCERRGKSHDKTKTTIAAHVLPLLGSIDLADLTNRKLDDWLNALVDQRPRIRGKNGAESPSFSLVDLSDPEVRRKRRASANRILTVLKAGLNLAVKRGHVQSDTAWSRLERFREADSAKVRFLTLPEVKRFLGACEEDLYRIAYGALLTGARYSELAALRVEDFLPTAHRVHISRSKSGKPRDIDLSPEGFRFFSELALGRSPKERLFNKTDGTTWKSSHQFRPMNEACARAEITPPIGFHILRHTYASHLAMAGVSMNVISRALGHADTRITEKHYAHFSPTFIAQQIRENLPHFGPKEDLEKAS